MGQGWQEPAVWPSVSVELGIVLQDMRKGETGTSNHTQAYNTPHTLQRFNNNPSRVRARIEHTPILWTLIIKPGAVHSFGLPAASGTPLLTAPAHVTEVCPNNFFSEGGDRINCNPPL